MPAIEVIEPNVQSELAGALLGVAKELLEQGCGEPMLILEQRATGCHAKVPLAAHGDWNNGAYRDHAMNTARKLVSDPSLDVGRTAIVTDTWHSSIVEREAFEASGLDFMKRSEWSQEDRDRWLVKREALNVTVESPDRAPMMFVQFYRRGPRGIEWQELEVVDGGEPGMKLSGRMVGLFPRGQ